MTVRLLKPYAQRPFNAIATFDASVEAGLIAAGQASADLTGGVQYFVPRPGLTLQSKQVAVGTVRLKMEERATATLPEGQVLLVTGGAASAGTVQRLDSAGAPLGSPIAVIAGTLPPIGPFAGTQQFQITCTAGNIDATVQDAVLTVAALTVATTAQLGGLKPDNATIIIDPVTGIATAPGGAGVSPRSLLVSAFDAPGPAPYYSTPAGLVGPGPGVNFPVAPSGQTITCFDTAANTLPATTTIDDTTDPIFGASNVRTFMGQFTSKLHYPKLASNFSVNAVDCTNKLIEFTMKFLPTVSVAAELQNVGNWRIRLYADGTPATPSANYISAFFGTSYTGDLLTGDWQKIVIPIEAFTQGAGATVPDVAAFATGIRYAAIELQHGGATTASFYVMMGSVIARPKTINKAMCVIAFDDLRGDTFSYAAKIMARYGFPGTLYPGALASLVGNGSGTMSLAQIKRLQDVSGWQIAA